MVSSRGRLSIRLKIPSVSRIMDAMFIFFCMFPFLLPNPIVSSDLQPYAAVMGTLICLRDLPRAGFSLMRKNHLIILGVTGIVALIVFVFSGMTMNGIRALFNYYSVVVIPVAMCFVLRSYRGFPETMVKACILLWFGVCTIQFFVSRTFALAFVSGARHGISYRGICGLASEPSFLGIACFYMLHLIRKFRKGQVLYTIIVVVMGCLYAQSAMGIIFIAAYWVVFLLDMTTTRKGIWIWCGTILAVIVGGYVLLNVLQGTRIHQLVIRFLSSDSSSVLSDSSVSIRLRAIVNALQDAWDALLMPQGFGPRIGSGYGGFLCELGFLAIPALWLISNMMSKCFRQMKSQVLYFVVVTFLLCNNTQIGNPLLLMIVGMNMYSANRAQRRVVRR